MSLDQDLLLKVLANQGRLTPEQANETGYDVQALQHVMDLVGPYLRRMSRYRPLRVWLREAYGNSTMSSQTDLQPFKNVRLVMSLCERTNEPRPGSSRDVHVFVGAQGKYLVCFITPATTQDVLQRHYNVRLIICPTAQDIAAVLHRGRDLYKDLLLPNHRVSSPLLVLARNLSAVFTNWMESARKELTEAETAATSMQKALSWVL